MILIIVAFALVARTKATVIAIATRIEVSPDAAVIKHGTAKARTTGTIAAIAGGAMVTITHPTTATIPTAVAMANVTPYCCSY